MTFAKKHAFKIAVLALCGAMAIYLYVSAHKGTTVNLNQNYKAPEFAMKDLDGNEVSLADTNGKVRVLYFFYANCPDVCPPTTFLMSKAQDELKKKGVFGKDVEFMSIDFNPAETNDVIRKFAGNFDVDSSGWKFLRSNSDEDVKKVMDGFGLGLVKDQNGYYTHADAITFIDRKGNVRKAIVGANDPESSADKIVDIVDALL
ncbi:SCO family protein [Paenibacillus humicola]|uniref:SCO family protein n=1 Tax=Paenibacillus humicola TaxID=3110540 RepID=UPI00237A7838|nr:SCO family protein [Paenibacillus humicola]